MNKKIVVSVLLLVISSFGISGSWSSEITCHETFYGNYGMDTGDPVKIIAEKGLELKGHKCKKVRKCTNTAENVEKWKQTLLISETPIDVSIEREEIVTVDLLKEDVVDAFGSHTYTDPGHSNVFSGNIITSSDVPDLGIEDSSNADKIVQDRLKETVRNSVERLSKDLKTKNIEIVTETSAEDVIKRDLVTYDLSSLTYQEFIGYIKDGMVVSDGSLDFEFKESHVPALDFNEETKKWDQVNSKIDTTVKNWMNDYETIHDDIKTSIVSKYSSKEVTVENTSSNTQKTITFDYDTSTKLLLSDYEEKSTERYYIGYEDIWNEFWGEEVEVEIKEPGDIEGDVVKKNQHVFNTPGSSHVKTETDLEYDVKVISPSISIQGLGQKELLYNKEGKEFKTTFTFANDGIGKASITDLSIDCSKAFFKCQVDDVFDSRLSEGETTQAVLKIHSIPKSFSPDYQNIDLKVDYKDGYMFEDVDLSGSETSSFKIKVLDRIDPVPSSQVSSHRSLEQEGKMWYKDFVEINLSCDDVGYGCDFTEYCIFNDKCKQIETYDSKFRFDDRGKITLRYTAKDKAENSKTKERIFYIDQRPPKIECDSCILPREDAVVGETLTLNPSIEDEGVGTSRNFICTDRKCSEVICESTSCEYTPEKPGVVRFFSKALDKLVHKQTSLLGSVYVKNKIGGSCDENSDCLSNNCDGVKCIPERQSPNINITE